MKSSASRQDACLRTRIRDSKTTENASLLMLLGEGVAARTRGFPMKAASFMYGLAGRQRTFSAVEHSGYNVPVNWLW